MKHADSPVTPAVLVLLAWGAISALVANQGLYVNPPDAAPYGLLAAVAVPPILFAIAYRASTRFREYVLGLNVTFLTALQGWRVIGGMFLVLMTYRIAPGTFAWPAGAGDMIVGFYAPFVVLALVRRSENWRAHVILLNILGLLDFVGAIGSGVLSGNNPLGILRGEVTTDFIQQLPLSIIPTFAVPAWIALHIVSLLQISRTTEGERVAA
jgi:hypothetical protein